MKIRTVTTIAATGFAATVLGAAAATAGCGIGGGKISVLGNDFPALHAVVGGAEACAGDGVEFSKNHTSTHRDLQVAALTADPAQYSVVLIANSSLVPLLNNGLVRPLDDLVARHGSQLKRSQLITIDGKIMAVAFMANAQHLFYRADILARVGLDAPRTYTEVLEAAEAIRAAGIMQYPYATNTMPGWNLGEEFINMYTATGRSFFEPGSATLAINNADGVASLNMLKSLVSYSNPDFLTFDSNETQSLWEGGELALATMWGSRGAAILDDQGSTADVTENHRAGGGGAVWQHPGNHPVVGRICHRRQHQRRRRRSLVHCDDERPHPRSGQGQ